MFVGGVPNPFEILDFVVMDQQLSFSCHGRVASDHFLAEARLDWEVDMNARQGYLPCTVGVAPTDSGNGSDTSYW